MKDILKRKRKVDLKKLNLESIDLISEGLNKEIKNFLDSTEEYRDKIEDELKKVNDLLSIYGLCLKVGFEINKKEGDK